MRRPPRPPRRQRLHRDALASGRGPLWTRATARVKASPLARRMARERGLDLSRRSPAPGRTAGSSPRTSRSCGPARPARRRRRGTAGGEVEVVQLTSTRKTIARRLTEAWQAPVFQLGVSADMTEVLALRERLVELLAEGDVKPTVNDVLTKLVAVALDAAHGRQRRVHRRGDPAVPGRPCRAWRSRRPTGSSCR